MKKYGSVQLAFKIIKTSTRVASADSLVNKFLNKEEAYGELLSKISSEEQKIVDLKI